MQESLNALGEKVNVRYGEIGVQFSNDVYREVNITFDKPMKNTSYIICATPIGGNYTYRFFISISEKRVDGFKLYIVNDDAQPLSSTSTRYINWIAIPSI